MAGIPDTRPKKGTLEGTRISHGSGKRTQPSPVLSRPVQLQQSSDTASTSFQPSPGYNSPYAAWQRTRIGTLALALIVAMTVLSGLFGSWFFGLIGTMFAAFWLYKTEYRKKSGAWLEALDGALDGRLPSKFCPDCGQSIFNHSRPGEVSDEGETIAFFPARTCANCGYDLTRSGNG